MKWIKLYEDFESSLEVDEIYEILVRDCSDFLNLLNECNTHTPPSKEYNLSDDIDIIHYYRDELRLLYRGNRRHTDDILEIHPRKDRRTKDMNQSISDEIDEMFYTRWKIRPRKAGVFTTPSKTVSGNFGTPYIFFPIGKFDYIWSESMKDLFTDIRTESIDDELGLNINWYLWETDYNNNYVKEIIHRYIKTLYRKEGSEQFFEIESGDEVPYSDILKIKQEIDEFKSKMSKVVSAKKEKWMKRIVDEYH